MTILLILTLPMVAKIRVPFPLLALVTAQSSLVGDLSARTEVWVKYMI